MDRPWLITDIADCSASDTVVIIIKHKRQRRQIIDNFGVLGDKVVDYYSQTQLYAVEDFFKIPHRLMVMGYRDYYENKEAIDNYLATNEALDFPQILIFGRLWRKLPLHPALIDGDDTTPEKLYKMFLTARGLV